AAYLADPRGATVTDHLYDRLQTAAAAVRGKLAAAPQVGLILGSGLGAYADKLASPVRLPFSEIPHFPQSHVAGHKGCLVAGERAGVRCIALQGRVHMYEGYDARTVAFPARVLAALGAKVVIVTNAAGGLNPSWAPGTLMLIRDHIDMLRDHAL